MTAEFQRRRDYVAERCAALRRLRPATPDGAMFFFLDCTDYVGRPTPGGAPVRNGLDIVMHLMERHHVALVPGDGFGDPKCVRLSFACGMRELERGMNRLVAGLHELD